MRKSSAVVEMNPISVPPPHSFSQPPFSRGYPTPHSLYIPARRPKALPMVHMGTANLKWKRDASAGSATPSTGTPPADVEMIHTGPVRFSRSLSYVRVAPYPTQATNTAETQKTWKTTDCLLIDIQNDHPDWWISGLTRTPKDLIHSWKNCKEHGPWIASELPIIYIVALDVSSKLTLLAFISPSEVSPLLQIMCSVCNFQSWLFGGACRMNCNCSPERCVLRAQSNWNFKNHSKWCLGISFWRVPLYYVTE